MTSNPESKSKPRIKEHEHQTYREKKKKKHEHHQIKEREQEQKLKWKLKDNIEAHLKYPNQPDRFADFEIDLHNDLHKLSILVGALELYLDLVNLNAIPSILNLLAHENTDIAVDVFEDDEESDKLARVLVDALVENSSCLFRICSGWTILIPMRWLRCIARSQWWRIWWRWSLRWRRWCVRGRSCWSGC